jgi:hypothetical protein
MTARCRGRQAARRATEIAIASRQRNLVQDAARLWAQLDPAAERPKRVLAALASDTAKGAFPAVRRRRAALRIERVLADAALSGTGVADVFLQLNQLFAQQPDKCAVLALIREVAKPHPTTPEAHFAVALAAFERVTTWPRRPKPPPKPIVRSEGRLGTRGNLKGEILARKSPAAAIQALEPFVAAHPRRRARPARSRSITSTRSASPMRAR